MWLVLWLLGCSSNSEPCAQAPLIPQYGIPQYGIAPMPSQRVPPDASAPVTDKKYLRKLAVLPIQEENLFRKEREAVRKKLHAALSRAAGDRFAVLPLATVDAEVTRTSSGSKARCVYERASLWRRAEDRGYLSVTSTVVSAIDDHLPELWIEAKHRFGDGFSWRGPWDYKLPLLERYDLAFSKLEPNDSSAVLGMLGGNGSSTVRDANHGVSFCESGPLQCSAETSAWLDSAQPLSTCFGDRATSRIGLLLEASPAPHCELDDVDNPSEPTAALERCVCSAVMASGRMKSLTRRVSLDIGYEAKEIAGKPRPLLAVVDADTNLRTYEESFGESASGWRTRLSLDGLKDIAPALARCAAAKQTVLVQVEVDDTGKVGKAKVSSGAAGAAAACIEKQLAGAGFDCTNDGKSATFQLAIRWSSPTAIAPKPVKSSP